MSHLNGSTRPKRISYLCPQSDPGSWYTLWPCKKVKKMSGSKQQVLRTTSSSQQTVKVKQFNQLWCPQKCFGHRRMHRQMHRRMHRRSALPGPYRRTPGDKHIWGKKSYIGGGSELLNITTPTHIGSPPPPPGYSDYFHKGHTDGHDHWHCLCKGLGLGGGGGGVNQLSNFSRYGRGRGKESENCRRYCFHSRHIHETSYHILITRHHILITHIHQVLEWSAAFARVPLEHQ